MRKGGAKTNTSREMWQRYSENETGASRLTRVLISLFDCVFRKCLTWNSFSHDPLLFDFF